MLPGTNAESGLSSTTGTRQTGGVAVSSNLQTDGPLTARTAGAEDTVT